MNPSISNLITRLRETAAEWVPRHFPNGRRVGADWRLANIRGDTPRKGGSCVIALRGHHAGDWIDFDGGEGSGPLSTLEHATGLKDQALLAYASQLVGFSRQTSQSERNFVGRREKNSSRQIERALQGATEISGTLGENYLRGRGLAPPWSADLRFHPRLFNKETGSPHPALIGLVRGHDGKVTGLHRTYLRSDGSGKAAIEKPRMMLGTVGGGGVRLSMVESGGLLGIAEGLETAMSVIRACPDLPVLAALSASNLERIVLPPEARQIILLADHDASGTGLRAATAAADRFIEEDRSVAIALPPTKGDDFNDLLLREGPTAVRDIIANAEFRHPPEMRSGILMRHNQPVGFADPQERALLRADEGDLARAHALTWDRLMNSNKTPWLFRSAGKPSWIVQDDNGTPFVELVTEEGLRYMLAKIGDWHRPDVRGKNVSAHPPKALIKSLLATPDPGLPVLSGIVTTPVFGHSGTLLTTPGYHHDARLFYQPTHGFDLPALSDRPSTSEIISARDLILEDLMADFPFTGPAERAHAIALLLLGFLRPMIDGPTPLHVIEKPAPGTGATLLVEVIATLITGKSPSVMTEGPNEEEWRKRLTAKLLQLPSIIFIDNLGKRLASSALAAVLTAVSWEDRILGKSEMAGLPIRCSWIATGNNPQFSNEMARRIVRIRLDSRVDRPWLRTEFRHRDLVKWARDNRCRLVAACLTLCLAWKAAGWPEGTRTLGVFEKWSRVMGGVLEVAGVEGFLSNLDDMLANADTEGMMLRSFVTAWWTRFETSPVGSRELYEIAQQNEPPLPLGSGGERSERTCLGKLIASMRDRTFACEALLLRVENAGVMHKAQRWRLVPSKSP